FSAKKETKQEYTPINIKLKYTIPSNLGVTTAAK
ncbi:MAG: hypothetical protein ACI936_003606, partial [Paraglaciecola sp.]